MNLYLWASRWGIPQLAIDELRASMGLEMPQSTPGATSEAGVQSRIVLAAADHGVLLMRNNVGAMQDETGRVVRFGLANVSKTMNKKVKSSDLIGITPVIVTPEMMGYKLGVFTAIEVKAPGWTWKGDDHELAQRKFGEIVMSYGGHFYFST